MYCQYCGKQIDDKAVICVHCGVPVQPVFAQNTVNVPVSASPTAQNGYNITSFVLSLVSILFGMLIIIPSLGLTFGIIGLYKSRESKTSSALGLAGLIISAIMLGLWLIFWICIMAT